MLQVLFFSVIALAARQERAHVHGDVHLAIAFDGLNGRIQMSMPSSVIYGFEYPAQSLKDKKNKEQGLKKLEDKISEIIRFDAALKCEIKKEIFEVDQRDNHSDIEAEFKVTCAKSPMGTKAIINFSKIFSHVKTVHIDVIGDGVQKSQEIKNNGEAIELK